jgi:hypothetical protein
VGESGITRLMRVFDKSREGLPPINEKTGCAGIEVAAL